MPGLLVRSAVACAATVIVETAVLRILLSRRHPAAVRLFAGVWLSLCTLPVVWFVLPEVSSLAATTAAHVAVAEILAPLLECGLFWWAFIRPLPAEPGATARDWLAIAAANLASFGVGEAIWKLTGVA